MTNRYVVRGAETLTALEAIGAIIAARLLRRVLRALPPSLRELLAIGGAKYDGRPYPWLAFGPHYAVVFRQFSSAYHERPAEENIDTLVMAYARRRAVGRIGAA